MERMFRRKLENVEESNRETDGDDNTGSVNDSEVEVEKQSAVDAIDDVTLAMPQGNVSAVDSVQAEAVGSDDSNDSIAQ